MCIRDSTPTPVPPARRLILLIILGTLPLFAILPIKDTVEGLSLIHILFIMLINVLLNVCIKRKKED